MYEGYCSNLLKFQYSVELFTILVKDILASPMGTLARQDSSLMGILIFNFLVWNSKLVIDLECKAQKPSVYVTKHNFYY